MAVFEAVESRFPSGIPERFVAARSVHVVGGGWVVRVDVRAGIDRALRHLAEEWALREVLQFRAGETGSTRGPEDDHSGPVALLQDATLEDLPRR